MKNSLRIHKWTHNEFNIFILGVLTHPLFIELLEKAVQLLHSLVKLLGRQHIVFHRIHLGIIDIEGPQGCLLQLCKYPYIG